MIVTGSGQADELRQEMADGLVAEGWITSPHVEAALRVVPRPLFMPMGAPLETAYNGHAVPVVKKGTDGVNLSSVSGPWLQGQHRASHPRPGTALPPLGRSCGRSPGRRGITTAPQLTE